LNNKFSNKSHKVSGGIENLGLSGQVWKDGRSFKIVSCHWLDLSRHFQKPTNSNKLLMFVFFFKY
jgi:hypothetical protein